MDRHSTPHPRPRPTRIAAAATATLLAAALADPAAAESTVATGPNTTTTPYLLPVADGVHVTTLLTVGDGAASNGYLMVGSPDGLGMMAQGSNLVLYMNHELGDDEGIVRRHGRRGAFVSRWVLDPETLEVEEGSDWINPGVQFWDYPSGEYVTAAPRFADGVPQDETFARFCSGTLSDEGLFFDPDTHTGWKGQIYFANEEDGDNGRVFGITKEGDATALPRLGLFEWENAKPAANRTPTTLVMGNEDGPADGSQLRAYVGMKQRNGPPVAKAGLTNGDVFVIDAVEAAVTTDAQWRAAYPKGTSGRVTLVASDWTATGAAQNDAAKADGLSLNRIEDGHWDPNDPAAYYFTTTFGGFTSGTGGNLLDTGGLWRLRWDDIEDPAAGATLTLLLDGSETPPGGPKLNKIDNLTIDTHGNVLIQEDPGNNNHLARVVAYRIADGRLGVVARFDNERFRTGSNPAPLPRLTTDEESSGIIDTEAFLGAGTFVLDAQAHVAKGLPTGTGPGTVEELVDLGQLLVLRIDDWSAVYGG